MSIMAPAFTKRQVCTSLWVLNDDVWHEEVNGRTPFSHIRTFLPSHDRRWRGAVTREGRKTQPTPQFGIFRYPSQLKSGPLTTVHAVVRQNKKTGKFCNVVLTLAEVWLQRRRSAPCRRSGQRSLPSPRARPELQMLTICTLKFSSKFLWSSLG